MKRIEVKNAPKEEQIRMVNEAGAEICRELGHIRIKHYRNGKGEGKVKCRRCGKVAQEEGVENPESRI